MKKMRYLLFTLILSIVVMPNVFAQTVEIKSIEQVDISQNTVVNNPPTSNGLEMNFDIGFKDKNDYIKYKVLIENNTNIDYKISNDTSFNKSDYIKYTYETTGDLKANSKVIVYVTITYINDIDSSLLVDGKYNETNKAVIKLLDKDGTPVNPNTGESSLLLLIFILVTLIIITVIIKQNKKIKISLIVIGLFLIPTLVYAVETLKLTINVKVEIKQGYIVAYNNTTNSLYKEEELDLYDTTNIICPSTYYLGEMKEENKYLLCRNVLYKEEKLYSAGERVNFKNDYKIRTINEEMWDDNIGDYVSFCEEQTNHVYLCDDRATLNNETIDMWWYHENTYQMEPYNTIHNDPSVMNFNSINKNWWGDTIESCIGLNIPGSFTMPNHNVLFVVSGPTL